MSGTEWMEIDGLSLELDDCWHVEDYAPVLSGSDQRGEDRLVPGSAGVVANPRRNTVTRVNLRMLVFGWKDWNGAAHATHRAGIGKNSAKLQAAMTSPPTTAGGTRTATYHLDGLPAVSKPVHVLGDMTFVGYGPYALRGVLRLSFPEGLFDLSSWLGP